MEPNKEQIKEINQHISDALEQWQNIMLIADADNWAHLLEYSDEDMLNALYIFNHVAQNRAIKSGFLDAENAQDRMEHFKHEIKDVFGFDTIELTNKVLKNGSEE